MRKVSCRLFLFILSLLPGWLQAQSGGNDFVTQSTSCDSYLDAGPITRSSGFGEENIVNGLYSGLAQRYNNINATITSVRFWARVPTSAGAAQIVRVVIYGENVGFPGTILAQTNVTVPASDSLLQVDAILPSAVNVNSNIIISIEPFVPVTDNVWVKHNQEGNASNSYMGDGGNLYLNLVKQGVTWFKNLSNGDPTWDYDFLILPVKTTNISAAFTFNVNNFTAAFSNSSTNSSSCFWDFGDGNNSTQTSPTHTYTGSGVYSVKLIAFGTDPLCYDSLIQNVTVSITGISSNDYLDTPELLIYSPSGNSFLNLKASVDMNVKIFDISGAMMGKYDLARGTEKTVNIERFAKGVYLINTPKTSYKFIKQ